VRIRHGETALQRRAKRRLSKQFPQTVVTEHFDAHQVREQAYSDVCAALDAHGVRYVLVPGAHGPESVAVCAAERQDAWTALRAELADSGWLVQDEGNYQDDPLGTVAVLDRVTSVVLYRRFVSAAGDPFAGPELGCALDFWRHVGSNKEPRPDGGKFLAGTHVAPRVLPVRYLSPTSWEAAAEAPNHWVRAEPARPIMRLNEPVDIVYTWVDGVDPRWCSRKARYANADQLAELHDSAANEARYFSRDELRYSLRSVAMYAPWVRRIHIVTDEQIPSWLNLDHPKIRVIDHKEIFSDPSVLPVFNSHAIESQLHHIPDLAEHYLYFNDDFFIGRRVFPETFFHANGVAKFFLSKVALDYDPPSRLDLPVTSAAKQNRALLEREFGVTVTQKFWHTPQPQLRSVLEQMECEHPEVFAQVAASRFRHPSDYSIPSSLAHYYAFQLGRSVPGRLQYRYQEIGTPQAKRLLDGMLRTRNSDVFCLNDTDISPKDFAAQCAMVRDFLERYYPVPSPFERTASTPSARRLGRRA
jgi:hypothetical protein